MTPIKTCSNNHDQVDYTAPRCPVCSIMDTVTKRIDEMVEYVDKVVDDQNEDIRRLKWAIKVLKLQFLMKRYKAPKNPLKMAQISDSS